MLFNWLNKNFIVDTSVGILSSVPGAINKDPRFKASGLADEIIQYKFTSL
jgi:hypothetical protein